LVLLWLCPVPALSNKRTSPMTEVQIIRLCRSD
jgi:hypothetical protein